MDVVLPTGVLVTATATNKYSDLFRALKGSGGRVGVVTSFTINVYPVGLKTDLNWFGGSVIVSDLRIYVHSYVT